MGMSVSWVVSVRILQNYILRSSRASFMKKFQGLLEDHMTAQTLNCYNYYR